MCVCVFGIHVLKIAVERWFWKVHIVFRSLVVLHVYVFLFSKNCFQKDCSTPPRNLAICRASKLFFLSQSRHLLDTWWINRESSCLLDSFSIARSIDRVSILDIGGLFLDTWSTLASIDDHFLDTYLDKLLDTSRHLHLSRFTDGQYILLVQSAAHFCQSLSWYLCLFISQTSLTHSKLLPHGFFKLFQDFLHLVSF